MKTSKHVPSRHRPSVFNTLIRSGVCFDAPSHILSVFVARVVNKIHNVNTVYLQKSKYMCVIQSKFTKTNHYFFQNGGGGAQRAGPGSTFDKELKSEIHKPLKKISS